MATDDQGNTYSKTIMDAAASMPVIKVMVAAKKAANKVAEKLKDLLDDDKIVPKEKPPRDIKPKPKPEPDIKPKLKLKPPRDERAKKNPYRLSSNRQPGIEVANTRTNNSSRLSTPGRRTTAKDLALRGKTLKDEGRFKEYAKGGEVKGYMGGGSVHNNKSKMITKRGWGASRKT